MYYVKRYTQFLLCVLSLSLHGLNSYVTIPVYVRIRKFSKYTLTLTFARTLTHAHAYEHAHAHVHVHAHAHAHAHAHTHAHAHANPQAHAHTRTNFVPPALARSFSPSLTLISTHLAHSQLHPALIQNPLVRNLFPKTLLFRNMQAIRHIESRK